MTLIGSKVLAGLVGRRWKGFVYSALSLALIVPIAASRFTGSSPVGSKDALAASLQQTSAHLPATSIDHSDPGQLNQGGNSTDGSFSETKGSCQRRLRFPS